MHPCLQFVVIYGQQITQQHLSLICHLSLRCPAKVFSCYQWTWHQSVSVRKHRGDRQN